MDNNNTQMENWKKQIIMDPILNSLFDHQLSAEDMLISKILTLPQDQIVNLYSKLAGLKHIISKSMQKQVQTKSEYIQKSFNNALEYRRKVDETSNVESSEHIISHLKKFNAKYQSVEQSLNYWSNITKVLNFSKALESFRVNSNILRTLMRGYNGQQQAINSHKIAKIIKQLYNLSINYDFGGMSYYQNQKVFIASTKSIVHEIAKKNIQKALILQNSQINETKITAINNLVEVFMNLNTLRQFITTFFKTLLMQLAEKIKQTFKQVTNNDINSNLENKLIPFILQACLSLLVFEEVLINYRKTDIFQQIPNLFTKFWQKLTEYFGQTINWMRKQHKNMRNKQNAIIWKYPILYKHCSALSDIIYSKLLTSTVFNFYFFAPLRQKFMLCIADLSVQYHNHCKQLVSISNVKQFNDDNYMKNIEKILSQCSSQVIGKSLVSYIYTALTTNNNSDDNSLNKIKIIKKKLIELFDKQGIKQNILLQAEHLAYFYIEKQQ